MLVVWSGDAVRPCAGSDCRPRRENPCGAGQVVHGSECDCQFGRAPSRRARYPRKGHSTVHGDGQRNERVLHHQLLQASWHETPWAATIPGSADPALKGFSQVCNHLGDLLEAAFAKSQLRETSVLPLVSGVPKWFTMLPASDLRPRARMDKV